MAMQRVTLASFACSESKQKNNNGEWRRRLRNLNSKFLPTENVRLVVICLQEVLVSEIRSYVHVGQK